ncbi:MAG: hypothetical protein HOQ19_12100 [Gemmatimonadaceae bacterium]|nr:hypothetical protein [Gemmatimonadaceae bacterium]
MLAFTAAHPEPARGQTTAVTDAPREIVPSVFVVASPTANVLVRLGEKESLVVGPPYEALVSAATRLMQNRAVRVTFVVLTATEDAPRLLDGGWGHAGALTLAQENLRYLLLRALASHEGPAGAIPRESPTVGFSEVIQLALSGDDAHVVHQQPAYSSADVIVHLEREHVIYMGNIYVSDGYPNIDVQRGGSLAGMISGVDFFVKNFGMDTLMQFVPGRGPVTRSQALRTYRDMLIAVRDTLRLLMAQGRSETEVLAAQPTRELDPVWGHGSVSASQFVSSAYRSLQASASRK